MPDLPTVVGGDDTFNLGMNGYTLPGRLQPGEYVAGMNIINRGGIAQTRPGSVSPLDLPVGNLQGCTFFTPSSGVPQMVFAIDGKIYASAYPFRSYAQLEDLQFNPMSRFVAWSSCIQTSDFNNEGTAYVLDAPRNILVIQDGATRAAYWDGLTARHLNPTISGGTVTQPMRDETVIGLWMQWSNNRLWVTRDNQVFASDIGNPLKFTETQYLNEGRAFYLTGPCTGIAEASNSTGGNPGIICFTATNTTFIQAAIQDRTLWLSTPGFQTILFPNVGCVAGRSIVHQYGLIWWFTSKGLVNQNTALSSNITSRLDVQDNEMIQSKYNLSYDMSGVAGSYFDTFLIHAVPNGDKLNTRVHVLDQDVFEDNANSWPAWWEGWRPVEFARGTINSQERSFCCSVDYDGVNRMWELFRPEKTDNGIPITCYLVTKQHFFENRDFKRFKYAELEFQGLSGETAVMVAAAGLRGAFQPIMSKDISATNGQMYYDSVYGYQAHTIAGSRFQTRISRTQDSSQATDCNSACVESDRSGLVDKCFQIMIAWSGILGITAYRLFAVGEPEGQQGECEPDETGEDRLINSDGCGVLDKFNTASPFTTYYASATFTKLDPDTGDPVTSTVTQASLISQVDADRKAARTAEWYVLSEIGEIV